VFGFRVVEERLTGVIPGGEVNMEPGSTFVVERFRHERGQLVFLTCQLLNGALEAERSVGGIESLGVPQIDLKLSAGELVVRSDNVESESREVPQRTQQQVLRIALQAGHVHVACC